MDRFWHAVRVYFVVAGKHLKARAQYRVDFFVSLGGIIVDIGVKYLTLWVLFSNITTLKGYSLETMLFFFAFSLIALSPVQIFMEQIWYLRSLLRTGTFEKYFTKPVPILVYFFSERIDLKGLGSLGFGLVVLAAASSRLGLVWTGETVGLLVLLLGSASLVFGGMMLLASSAAFWIRDSSSILSFVSSFRDHAKYPLDIYDPLLRTLFTWVIPVGFVSYYPSLVLLGSVRDPGLMIAGATVAVAFFGAGVVVWNRGARRWASPGA